MRYLLFSLFALTAKIFRKLANYFNILSEFFYSKNFQNRNVLSSTRYDMNVELNEIFYANQYWKLITPHLIKYKDNPKFLDLGCGQGRFSLKMAKKYPQGQITGIDLSAQAISQAKSYAKLKSLTNVEFINQSIEMALKSFNKNEFDVIFLTEVVFFWPEWKKYLPKIRSLLKPGGLFILSSRSQYFNALCLVKIKNWFFVNELINKSQGRIFNSPITFAWQTGNQIKSLLESTFKFKILDQRGIGVCSGILGDPHGILCEPSTLDDEAKKSLMKLELYFGRQIPDAGRYILTIAKKNL